MGGLIHQTQRIAVPTQNQVGLLQGLGETPTRGRPAVTGKNKERTPSADLREGRGTGQDGEAGAAEQGPTAGAGSRSHKGPGGPCSPGASLVHSYKHLWGAAHGEHTDPQPSSCGGQSMVQVALGPTEGLARGH